jgi:hypothetical protein
MGYYVNPHEKVNEGRKIEAQTYKELVDALQPGEVPIGQYQRPLFKNTIVLFSKEEFEEFDGQLKGFYIMLVGYYAVPLASLQGYVDGGIGNLKKVS